MTLIRSDSPSEAVILTCGQRLAFRAVLGGKQGTLRPLVRVVL
jgi:hypothetical protein